MIYEFQATQDLHGYAKPWAPGTHYNKFDGVLENGDISDATGANSGSSSSRNRSKNYIDIHGATKYYPYSPNHTGAFRQYYYDEEYTYLGYHSANWNTVIDLSNDAYVDDVYYVRFRINAALIPDDIIAFNIPETITNFTPYANICPPEGFNIWDPTNQEYVQVYAGFVNTNTRELYLRPVYQEYAGEELVGPWMSSLDEYSEDATPTEGAFVIDFGGELESFEITPFMLQTLLDSLGIRQHFTNGAGLLNSLMDQAQGRVRSEEELLHLSRPLKVIAIGDQLPAGITFKPISKDVLPGLPGKFIR